MQTKYYHIRKDLIWLLFFISICCTAYIFYDWWSHQNWPPHSATHPEAIKRLNCPSDDKYIVTQEQIPGAVKHTSHGGSLDRRIYFDHPQCVAGQYLAFEGSGVRLKTYVYDVEKKRRTATIVITFEKYQGD